MLRVNFTRSNQLDSFQSSLLQNEIPKIQHIKKKPLINGPWVKYRPTRLRLTSTTLYLSSSSSLSLSITFLILLLNSSILYLLSLYTSIIHSLYFFYTVRLPIPPHVIPTYMPPNATACCLSVRYNCQECQEKIQEAQAVSVVATVLEVPSSTPDVLLLFYDFDKLLQ